VVGRIQVARPAWRKGSSIVFNHFRNRSDRAMKFRTLALAAAMIAGATSALANDPKATIADLDARLSKIGAAHVEGTDTVGDKTVPGLYFGERKINNNFDVVDALRKAHQATATVFVKSGDEFVRVSTNVLTPEGKRGVGTQLARNAAYAAVSKGEQFCGVIDVLGTPYDSCYNPIKDKSGAIIGVSYVGHKK
jgi:hypothetical protein